MPLYKLTPNYSIWPKTVYKSDVIVLRAASKEAAMKLVKLATFTLQPKKSMGKQTPNPWLDRSFAFLEVYTGNEFPKEGQEEILSPDWLRNHFLTLI